MCSLNTDWERLQEVDMICPREYVRNLHETEKGQQALGWRGLWRRRALCCPLHEPRVPYINQPMLLPITD